MARTGFRPRGPARRVAGGQGKRRGRCGPRRGRRDLDGARGGPVALHLRVVDHAAGAVGVRGVDVLRDVGGSVAKAQNFRQRVL